MISCKMPFWTHFLFLQNQSPLFAAITSSPHVICPLCEAEMSANGVFTCCKVHQRICLEGNVLGLVVGCLIGLMPAYILMRCICGWIGNQKECGPYDCANYQCCKHDLTCRYIFYPMVRKAITKTIIITLLIHAFSAQPHTKYNIIISVRFKNLSEHLSLKFFLSSFVKWMFP